MTDDQSPGYLQHTWSSPTMRAAAPSLQTLPPAPYQYPYPPLFPGQVHYSQLYQIHHQSQQLQRPPSPFQERCPTSPSDLVSPSSNNFRQDYRSFPYFQYPSPSSTFYQHIESPPTVSHQSLHHIHSKRPEDSRKPYHPSGRSSLPLSITFSL